MRRIMLLGLIALGALGCSDSEVSEWCTRVEDYSRAEIALLNTAEVAEEYGSAVTARDAALASLVELPLPLEVEELTRILVESSFSDTESRDQARAAIADYLADTCRMDRELIDPYLR